MEPLDKVELKHGGAREGSGRKPGVKLKRTLAKEAAALRLTKIIEERTEELAAALIEKALTGDIPAIKEAFERGLGKVIEKRQIEFNPQPIISVPQQEVEKEPQ